MATTWVLRFPQVDKPQQPVLIHVTQKPGTTLDLDLLATDGEDAYRGKVRQRKLAQLRYKNFEGTDEEWSALLHYVLVSKQSSNARQDHTRNLDVDCSITGRNSKSTLSITLRSRIEDITHKLGTIELSFSDNTDDVDLFGWACQLADQCDRLEEQATTGRQQAGDAKATISRLETQLNELVQAKEEHEDQLLSKFAALLNEKKAKIRNQQRILQTAKVDQKKLNELQLTIGGGQADAKGEKRKRGRDRTAEEDGEDAESDGFEAMDIDKDPADKSPGDVYSGRETPPQLSPSPETETASEDDGTSANTQARNTSASKSKGSLAASPPPPPRSLPFQRKGHSLEQRKETVPSPPSKMDEDVSTESEDDEL